MTYSQVSRLFAQTPEDFGSMDSDVGLEKRILKNLYIPPQHCAQGCIFLLVVLGLSWTYISLSRHFKRKKQTYYSISKH